MTTKIKSRSVKIVLASFAMFTCAYSAAFSQSFKTDEARYSFSYRKDSAATICALQVSAIDPNMTNAFSLEFGSLAQTESKNIYLILYFDWHDIFTANGVVQKMTKLQIGNASIKGGDYNSLGRYKSTPQSNGELWQTSNDIDDLSKIAQIFVRGNFSLQFSPRQSNSVRQITITNGLPKVEFEKFFRCFKNQIEK